MERWNGKVAVVTGASSGIGLSIAKTLVQHGMIVVGLARRKEQMEKIMSDIKGPGKFYARKCDIANEKEVIESLKYVKNTFGSLSVLVNNAGYASYNTIEDSVTSDMENTFQVNVFGLLYCSKHAIKIMKENDSLAHIVNIGSYASYEILKPLPGCSWNVYSASKFAVRALSESLRNELGNCKIRVSLISPALTKSEMVDACEKILPSLSEVETLEAEDVAATIIHALGAPDRVEITEIRMEAKGFAACL